MPDNVQERLVALRDLVHRAPSPSGWKAICDLLTRWPAEDDLAVGLDYAEANLDDRWPDELREPDPRWWKRFTTSREEPRLRLVRALLLSPRHLHDGLDRLLGAELLHRIHHIGWRRSRVAPTSAQQTREDLLTLLRSPKLANLGSLSMGGLNPSLATMLLITDDHHLPGLHTLNLRGCGLTPPLTMALARGPRRLRHLDLTFNELEAADLRMLLRAPWRDSLVILDLASNALGDGGVQQLGELPWAHLAELRLESNNVRVTGAEALARSPHLGGLKSLNLSRNNLFVRGSVALARSTTLTGLTGLALADIWSRPDQVVGYARQFCDAMSLPRLKRLNLGQNPLGDEGAAVVARSPWLERLEVLQLAYSGLGDEGARALARSPHVGGLKRLDLRHNAITDEGAEALATSEAFERMQGLRLRSNPIRAAGGVALARSRWVDPQERVAWSRLPWVARRLKAEEGGDSG